MNTVRQAGMPPASSSSLPRIKGVIAISVGRFIVGTEGSMLLAAFCALVGVNWSVFVGFAGGRGTTLSLFMLVQVSLWGLVILAALWLAVYAVRRNNFIATRVVILRRTPVAWAVTGGDWRYILCALGFSSILLIRHRRETDDHPRSRESVPSQSPDPPAWKASERTGGVSPVRSVSLSRVTASTTTHTGTCSTNTRAPGAAASNCASRRRLSSSVRGSSAMQSA
jgi:glycerol-3-phosphate acyltransferase PlsY